MTTLRDILNIPSDKILLMEMLENGRKVAEDDVSEMNCEGLKMAIEIQEMLGRTCTYKVINLKNR